MEFRCGAGHSMNRNAVTCLGEAIEMAKSSSGIKEPSFALVYCTIGYPKSAIEKALNEHLKGIPHVGSSGEGVISSNFADEGNFSISVQLFEGSYVKFESQIFEDLQQNDQNIGLELGEWINSIAGSRSTIIFPDGLNCNTKILLDSASSKVDDDFPIFGGLSGDNFEMKETYQIINGKVYSNSLVATTLCGDFEVLWDVSHGCSSVGNSMEITKCDGNKLYELDNRNIFDVLKEYNSVGFFEDWSKTVMNLTIGLSAPTNIKDDYDKLVIRSIMGRDETAEKYITLSENISEGQEVWLTRRDIEKLSAGVKKITKSIKEKLNGRQPKSVFHFDCAGRGRLFMDIQKRSEGITYMQKELDAKNCWSGFYTYGEIAPVNGKNYFHNLTAVLVVIV